MAAGIINHSIDELVFIHKRSIEVAGFIGVAKCGHWRVQKTFSAAPRKG